MYCVHCGKEIKEGAKFCTFCGAPTKKMEIPEIQSASDVSNTSKGSKKLLSAVIILLIGIIAAGGVYFGYKMYEKNKEEKYQQYLNELSAWCDEIEDTSEKYKMSSEDKETYDDLLSTLKDNMRNEKGRETNEKDKKDLDEFIKELEENNKNEIQTYMEELKGKDTSLATSFDLEAMAEYEKNVTSYLEEASYDKAYEELEKWEGNVEIINNPPETYNVTIKQYDLSDYPKVKYYVNIEDKTTGQFIKGLSTENFYLNEKRSFAGEMSRAKITKIAEIDEQEALSIALAADISGSMQGSLEAAKQSMINFINTVQFKHGDEVELVKFADATYICNSFTNDKNQIINNIQQMGLEGSTRLYDTLVGEIERVYSCDSAKCVVGFTDGYDNVSMYTAEDVINIANAYQIPVFLIGVGSQCDENTLRHISESTGGTYQNISDVDELDDIYQSIYKNEKEVYLLEYEIEDGENFDDLCITDLYVRTEDGNGGYVESYELDPKDFFDLMYNKFLVAGIDCQTKGERNLLDSGLIVTTQEAYGNKECIAYQSQAAIQNGGVGSSSSNIFEVLTGHQVIDVEKTSEGYTLYGMCTYDISKVKKKKNIKNDVELQYINNRLNYADPEEEICIEESIYNYEKLTMVKNSEGKWQFNTRTYERKDGGESYGVSAVYNAYLNDEYEDYYLY